MSQLDLFSFFVILKKVNINLAIHQLTKFAYLYSNLKDKIDSQNFSGVVYKIPCKDCNKSYIGTTKNKLGIRIKQHKNDCCVKHAHKPNSTALAYHHFSKGHNFDFDNTEIVTIESNHRKRFISELLHIKHNNNSVNFNSDTQSFNAIYSGLLS